MTESMSAMICANAGKCASQRSIHKQHQNSRKDETSNVFKTFEVFLCISSYYTTTAKYMGILERRRRSKGFFRIDHHAAFALPFREINRLLRRKYACPSHLWNMRRGVARHILINQ